MKQIAVEIQPVHGLCVTHLEIVRIFIISRRREILICTMCLRACVRACVGACVRECVRVSRSFLKDYYSYTFFVKEES